MRDRSGIWLFCLLAPGFLCIWGANKSNGLLFERGLAMAFSTELEAKYKCSCDSCKKVVIGPLETIRAAFVQLDIVAYGAAMGDKTNRRHVDLCNVCYKTLSHNNEKIFPAMML
jgi:hypothetical protein